MIFTVIRLIHTVEIGLFGHECLDDCPRPIPGFLGGRIGDVSQGFQVCILYYATHYLFIYLFTHYGLGCVAVIMSHRSIKTVCLACTE